MILCLVVTVMGFDWFEQKRCNSIVFHNGIMSLVHKPFDIHCSDTVIASYY